MTLSRRSFTFASLLAALAPATAEAGRRSERRARLAELEEAGAEAAPSPGLVVAPDVRAERGRLVVRLEVGNDGAPTNLVVALGSRPGGTLTAWADVAGQQTELALDLAQVDRREMVSRMGPPPRFQVLAAGERVTLGPWRFVLPDGARPPGTLEGTLSTSEGDVPFRVEGVTWGDSGASA